MCVNRYALHCYCLHLTCEIYPMTKKRQEKNSSLHSKMSKCIRTMVEGFLWIQSENLIFGPLKWPLY